MKPDIMARPKYACRQTQTHQKRSASQICADTSRLRKPRRAQNPKMPPRTHEIRAFCNWLHHFDWGTLTAPRLIENGSDLDWSPNRATWVTTTTTGLSIYDRRRHPLRGDAYRRVWTSQLWAGNWKTGKKKQIVSGLAWVGSVSLRP